ncbi:hypothetical protein [Acetobacter fabarum]
MTPLDPLTIAPQERKSTPKVTPRKPTQGRSNILRNYDEILCAIKLNVELSLEPRVVKPVIITTAIKEAIRAYSIAVTPRLSLMEKKRATTAAYSFTRNMYHSPKSKKSMEVTPTGLR